MTRSRGTAAGRFTPASAGNAVPQIAWQVYSEMFNLVPSALAKYDVTFRGFK